jgi:flagellar motility protein MotE (MotC chaperone)
LIKIAFLLLSAALLFAAQKSSLSADDCNKIFEQRKQELVLKLELIDEKQHALDALQNASKTQQGQREDRLKQKLGEINILLEDIKRREASIKATLDENKKILEEIQKAKENRLTQTYAKMKPAAAAAMLSEMNTSSSASILFTLEPKKVAEFLSKMDAKKASEVSERIKRGPPF